VWTGQVEAAVQILNTADAFEKAALSRTVAAHWRSGALALAFAGVFGSYTLSIKRDTVGSRR
jgi:hypothetical protein